MVNCIRIKSSSQSSNSSARNFCMSLFDLPISFSFRLLVSMSLRSRKATCGTISLAEKDTHFSLRMGGEAEHRHHLTKTTLPLGTSNASLLRNDSGWQIRTQSPLWVDDVCCREEENLLRCDVRFLPVPWSSSLCRICSRCLLTVARHTPRNLAISLLLYPLRIRSAT